MTELRRARCKFCSEPIWWGVFPASGKRAPIDYEPAENGNIVIIGEGRDGPLLDVIRKVAATLFDDDDRPRYLNHWATCTNPPERKKR